MDSPAMAFSACLEVSEMVALNRTAAMDRNVDAAPGVGGGDETLKEWSAVRCRGRRRTLSEVLDAGAFGLEAFVGRKGR